MSDAHPHHSIVKNSYLVIALFLLASCMLAGLAFRHYRALGVPAPTERQVLDECGHAMGVEFPPGTRLINFAFRDGSNRHLKIRVREQDIEVLLRKSPFAGKSLSRTINGMEDRPDLPWWRPERATKFMFGDVMLPTSDALHILVVSDDDGSATVYLFEFEV